MLGIEVVCPRRSSGGRPSRGKPAGGAQVVRRRPAVRDGPISLTAPAATVIEPPLRRLAPCAASHDKQSYRRLMLLGCLISLEVALKPAQPAGENIATVRIQRRPRTEIDIPGMRC